MGAGLCYVELTDVFCSALLDISEFKNAAVCVCTYILLSLPKLPIPQENLFGRILVYVEFTRYSIGKSALSK